MGLIGSFLCYALAKEAVMACRSLCLIFLGLWFAAASYASVGWVIHPDEKTAGLDWKAPVHPDIQLVQEDYQVTIIKPNLSARVTETLVFHNCGGDQQVGMFLDCPVNLGSSLDNLEVYVEGKPAAVTRWYAVFFRNSREMQDQSSAEGQLVYNFRNGESACFELRSYQPPGVDEEFSLEENGGFLADTWEVEMPANGQVTVKCSYDFNMHSYYSNMTVLPIAASPGWRGSIDKWKAEICFTSDAQPSDIFCLSGRDVSFQPSKSGDELVFAGEDIASYWSDVHSDWYGGVAGIVLYGQSDPLYSHPLVQASADSPLDFYYDLIEDYPKGFGPPQLTQSSYVEILDVQGDWVYIELLDNGAEGDQIRRMGWIYWRGYLDCSSVPRLQIVGSEPQSLYSDEECSQLHTDTSQIYTGEWVYLLRRTGIDTCQVLVGSGEGIIGWNKLSSAEELCLGYIRLWQPDEHNKMKMNFELK
jgi:hypothetical protein